jgi:spermidine/putrescine-binding protein
MTLTIELSPQEEAWLTNQATQQGLQPTDVVKRLIDGHLPVITPKNEADATPVIDAKNAAAIAYLDARIMEDATNDPEEIRRAEEEFEELKRNLNANRASTGERLVFP